MGHVQGKKALLFKPLTFMNRSGEAVREMLDYFGISAKQMLVIHDDLDLPCDRIKLTRRGGGGGHRGVLSIIDHLKSQDFPRLKMGIGRPLEGEPIEAYVLQKPYSQEAAIFEEMVIRGAQVAQATLFSDLEEVMNRFNRRDPYAEGS
jgi:PTH1 family peptidyl-tRNA hydrolase